MTFALMTFVIMTFVLTAGWKSWSFSND
jgi:hypothetical protein